MAILRNLGIIPLLLLTLNGCGYRLTGGGELPGGVAGVGMGVFENRSGETGVDGIIGNDIVYELTRNGKRVSYNSGDEAAVLSGTVLSVTTQSVSRQSVQSVQERRVTVRISLELTDANGGVIWKVSGLSENEAYEVADDRPTTELNKREAIKTLSGRLAEKVYYRMTDDF